ncbi:hypothetical protein NQU33_24785, partial [Escherichia coli]|nr:hypothetical protein [Escherichia coli]
PAHLPPPPPHTHTYEATSQEPALAARQLNRHLLLLLQQGCLPLSGINNASALSGN